MARQTKHVALESDDNLWLLCVSCNEYLEFEQFKLSKEELTEHIANLPDRNKIECKRCRKRNT